MWRVGDDQLFEDQLIELADKIIDGGFYKNYACSFFTENMGKPLIVNFKMEIGVVRGKC